jgi:ACS family tartrate transporter-like MFS transporter
MAAVVGPHSFYALRLLLGAAEAGLYPGVLLYISLWFPKRAQAFALAIFSCSGPLALSIGNVLSTILMEGFHEFAGFRGWQWMYFLEGIPAVILGFVTFFILSNSPADARWLPEPNRKWIIDQLSKERAQTSKEGERNPASVMLDKDVLIYSFIFFCLVQGNLGLSIWLPQIIRQVGAASVYESGFLSALPYICAVPVMILVARHSDRTQERQLHVMFSAFAGALGLVLSTLTGNFALSLVALCFAAAGILSALGTFFSMPMGFLSGAVAAVALAFINAVGNFGGFVGPYMIGLVKDATQGFAAGLWVLAAFLAVGGLLALRQPSGRFAKSASLRGRDTATTNSAMVK